MAGSVLAGLSKSSRLTHQTVFLEHLRYLRMIFFSICALDSLHRVLSEKLSAK